MATKTTSENEGTDIAELWTEALKSYYVTTGQDLRTLPKFRSVNDIMNDAQLKNDLFDNFRHDKGKVDKLRSAVTRNSDLVMKGAEYIAQAAIPAFPPAAAILTAFTYVMKACKDVSADYDRIVSFFDEMNNFLERVSIIESRMPTVPAYKVFLTRVFASMMNLLAVATKAVKKGRFKKWFKTLLEGGGDEELSSGYSEMETALKRLESATNFATLGNTEEIKKDTKTMIVTTGRVDITTQRIDLATQDIHSSVKEGFLQVTELQSQLAENFAKMMEAQKAEAAKKTVAPTHTGTKPTKDPGARKHAAFTLVSRTFLTPSLLKEQARDIESSFVSGTASWAFEEQVYQDWSSSKASNLFIVGGPGIGKSHIAFSAVKRLQDTAEYTSRTSVAYFYFKKEYAELLNMSKAISSIIVQLAGQDAVYCEQVAAEITKLEFDSVDTNAWQDLWEKYLVQKFPSDSEGRAHLVLDGLDETIPAEKKILLDLLSKLEVGKTNIQALVTLRPDAEYVPENIRANSFELFITKEKISVDFPRLINARMDRITGLTKIGRFRTQVKRKISTDLQEKADGMLYVELMLRRYNTIGREGSVLRDIVEFKPKDLSSLYGYMLADLQERRSPEQYQSLKKLFAWLAYSQRPLTLNEASAVVNLTGQDTSLDIEEELEGKSSRILELTAPLGYADNEESDEDIKEKDEAVTSEDGTFPLRFQERSLREYFQELSIDNEGLRTSPSSGHLTIFENIASVLSGTSKTSEQLSDYAVKFWLSHFESIDPTLHSSEKDAIRVLESLALIFNNALEATRLIEKYGTVCSNFGDYSQGISKAWFFVRVSEWIAKSPTDVELLNEATRTWVEAAKTSPLRIVASFVEGHVKNWFAAIYPLSMVRSLEFAIFALSYTDLYPPLTERQKTKPSIELITFLGALHGHSAIDGRNLQTMGLVLNHHRHWNEAIAWYRKNIDDTDPLKMTVFRRFYSYVSIAQAQMSLAENNDEGDDDQPYVLGALESINIALNIEYTPTEEILITSYAMQRRQCFLMRASCERRLKKLSDAVISYEAAKAALPTNTMLGADLYKWTLLLTDEQLMETLAHWTLWDRMCWLTYDNYLDDSDESTEDEDEAELDDPNFRFQRAAKLTNKLDFLVETYEQIIAYKIASKQAGGPRLSLAQAYIYVIEDIEKAKKVLYDILDSDCFLDSLGEEDIDSVFDTRSEIADVIYKQFRLSSSPAEKLEYLNEFKKIAERRLARNVSYFGVYNNDTTILAARMTKVVGTKVEFQDILERMFECCWDGLTDAEGWNDCGYLRLLGKVLVLAGGLNREAAICFSAQFSIIDPTVEHDDSDSDSDSDDDEEGSNEGGEKSSDKTNGLDDGSDNDSEESDSEDGEEDDGNEEEKEGEKETEEGVDSKNEKPENKKKIKDEKEENKEDIAPGSWIVCDGDCPEPTHDDFTDGPIYNCLVCNNCDFCQACYDKNKKAHIDGEPEEKSWRQVCGKDHSFIKAPVEGWKGIKDGVMTIGEEKTVFLEWMKELKEVKWKAAWERFWLDDGVGEDILTV